MHVWVTFGIVVRIIGFDPGLLQHVFGAAAHILLPIFAQVFLRGKLRVSALPSSAFFSGRINFKNIDFTGNDISEDLVLLILVRVPWSLFFIRVSLVKWRSITVASLLRTADDNTSNP